MRSMCKKFRLQPSFQKQSTLRNGKAMNDDIIKELIKELLEKIKTLAEAERTCKVENESQRKSIMELEAFKKYAEMTPRILSERIIRLEHGLKVLSDRYVKIGGKL